MNKSQLDEKEIFGAALSLESANARLDYLKSVCSSHPEIFQRVSRLLQLQAEPTSFLEAPAAGVVATLAMSAPIERAGMVIGRYKLRELLGEGGMGSVYVAEQEQPVRRKVALKIIKPGMDSRQVISRFESERQALALMDHPNIAKVLDAGTTDTGLPYFVMELVKGAPITEYCDDQKLSTRQRLELFIQVCQAVQHAHQKGIIHRDIKPSNVMVTVHDVTPVVKVIDFGVAKAIGQQLTDNTLYTAVSQMIGTPLYMSPEQAGESGLDIDTRSDVYALGVLMYELLTGCTPFESESLKRVGIDEMRRMIREVDPKRPSDRLSTLNAKQLSTIADHRQMDPRVLRQQVRGELDWIVMKALEKDRDRRYGTANGLALDIQRHLSGEVVQAAPPSRAYLLSKFVRRNRGPVVAASLLLLALLAGMIGTSYGFWQARLATNAESLAKADAQQRQAEAERERSRAEQRELEAIDAVRKFGEAVAQNPELKNSPQLDALRKTLLKEPFAFFQSLRERLQTNVDTRPESLALLAKAAFELGKLTDEIGDKQDALRAYQEALSIWERLARENPSVKEFQNDLAGSHNNIGKLLRETGKLAEALAAYEQARTIWERLAKENPAMTDFLFGLGDSQDEIGHLYRATGKPTEAMAAYEQARPIWERLARENSSDMRVQTHLAGNQFNLGSVFSDMGKKAEALAAYERALATWERLTRENPTVTSLQHNVAATHSNIGNKLPDAEALVAYEKARTIDERLARENPTVTMFQRSLATAHNNIGTRLRNTGNSEEALAAFEQARAIQERLAAENPTVTGFQIDLARSHNNIGSLLKNSGKQAEALAAYQQALAIHERLARDTPTLAEVQNELAATHDNIGLVLKDMGKKAEALAEFKQALAIRERAARDSATVGMYNRGLAFSHNILASELKEQGKLDEAIAEYRESARLDPKWEPPHYNLSWLLFEQGKLQEALDVYRDAIRIEPDIKWYYLQMAWLLCMMPESELQDPDLALKLATKGCELYLERGDALGTLGMAQYRAGHFAAAVETLENSIKRSGDQAVISFRFFLALAHWQLGHKEEARHQFDKSVQSMEQPGRSSELLKRIRAEAEELLGIADNPAEFNPPELSDAQQSPTGTTQGEPSGVGEK